MAKFYGAVGYGKPVETKPGVWENETIERYYYGDETRTSRRLQSSNGLNDNIAVACEISIIADPFAYDNFHLIKYVEYMGVKWKVSNVEVQFPRLVFSLGDVYNG